ncbi:MAG: VWA domain-containing protein [bacterium]|nr:VWA domain-containing protein [bacterium]
MFSFLNSTILFAAAAALIPLIIHLFSRRRVKVIEFSSLRHLKEMQRRQLRRLKIRQLLLLIIRMLIILCVVLAFARPTIKEGGVGSHAAVSAVVLVDNSASMRRYVLDGDLFEIARARVQELLNTFSQSDEVCLLALDRAAGESGDEFASAAVAVEKLSRLQSGAGRADLEAALGKAVQLLDNATNLNREVYLVTDRQRTSLPEAEILSEVDIELYLVDLPLEEVDNLGVVALDFGGQLIQAGHDFDLVATIRNYGNQEATDRIASLFVNGKRVAQTDFDAAAGSETTVRFTRAVSRTGFHSGYVELSDDKFPGDNRQFFSFRIPDQFNLLIIDGDEAASFLSLALVPPASGGQYWSVKEASPQELSGVSFSHYDVVVLAGAPRLEATYLSRLQNFVHRGKSLLITYGGRTDIDYFNEAWSSVTGVTYQQAVRRSFNRAGYYSLQSLDLDHPIFSVFDLEEGKPPEVKFFTLPELTIEPRVSALMEFTGDRPALVEARYGRGKVLTFTGPVSPQYADLVSHGFFVPFVARVSEYLASDLSSLDLRLLTGTNITRALSSEGAVMYAVDLVAPDSSVRRIPPEEENGAQVIHTGPLGSPGVYLVSHQGREVDRFAVNLDPAECDLTTTETDQFALSLGREDYRQVETDAPIAEIISGFRIGRELWQIFLWAAVLLLIAEMLLGRQSSPTED